MWWLLLFTVLPFGVNRHTEAGKGYDMGAPAVTNLKKKMLINSALTAVVVAVIWLLVHYGVIRWGDWFRNGIPTPK